ncbi:DMT family transporter [Paenibacillus woosongensis]|uniref:EamA family transporter n=1 Tax=Paenibacillus woosongensis TaxID=307580 RepID=A0A7X3CMH8_9BACL|nr:DMT family transporter [Paenibacillus woosongensis]MUG44187.1 EamA family transporter [Paenibacillus woosongensis]
MENATVGVKIKPSLPLQAARPKSGFWLVVLGAALWGADPLFRIILLKSLTSAQIVLLEHIIIALIAIPVMWKNRQELRGMGWRQAGALLFISWGGSAIATILFTMGLVHGNPNAVLLLQKLQPLFAIVLARMLLKERLPRHFSWLIILALAGTYLLTFGFTLPIGHWSEIVQVGSLLSLGAAALWGGSTVMGRLMVGQMKYETVTSLRFVLALPLLFAITWNEGAAWNIPTEAGAFAAVSLNLLGQALLPGLLSLLVYYKGLTTTKASVATLAELSFPMVGVLINWIAFQEMVTAAQAFGFMLIWATLFVISRQSQAAPDAALKSS